METRINTKNERSFQIVQGSNYKVTDSYGNEYIIDFNHFQKLSNAVFNGEGEFTTINNTIINKRYIFKIEPTKELTDKQRQEKEAKQEQIRLEKSKKDEISKQFDIFRVGYLNKKYGKDNWNLMKVMLNEALTKEIWNKFKELYPKESKFLEENK